MAECPRIGKLLGGCKWEARYDEPSLFSQVFGDGLYTSLNIKGENGSIENIIPTKKYVRDVCIRCGKTIERSK